MPLPKNLQVIPGLPLEKDELYRDELSAKYKEVKEAERVLSARNAELKKLHQLKSASKGLEPAYIDTDDLVSIIEDLLLTKSPVSKAFDRHEMMTALALRH